MNALKVSTALLSILAATACGQNQNDRALSGAGIGAGVGAVGSAITGGNPATGAAVGAGAGTITLEGAVLAHVAHQVEILFHAVRPSRR